MLACEILYILAMIKLSIAVKKLAKKNEALNMNKIIVTLCLIMITLIGASAVAASSDADNSSNVELGDIGDSPIMPIDPSSNVISENQTINTEDTANDWKIADKQAQKAKTNKTVDIETNETVEDGTLSENVNVTNTIEDGTLSENVNVTYTKYDKIMKVVGNNEIKDFNEKEINYIINIYTKILDSYNAGVLTKQIAKDYNMTPEEIQNIADLEISPIEIDPKVDAVYKMYDSVTVIKWLII